MDARGENELVAEVTRIAAQLRQHLAGVLAAARSLETEAEHRSATDRSALDREMQRAAAIAGNHAAQGVIEHRSRLLDAARQLAPGPASLPWSDPAFLGHRTEKHRAPSAVRIGTLAHREGVVTNEAVEVPWLVPLLDRGSVALTSSDAQSTDPVITAILARTLASTTPGQLIIDCFDPRLRTALSPFAALRKCDVLSAPFTDGIELEEHLAMLSDQVAHIAEQRGGAHRTLGEVNAGAGQVIAPYRLLVLFDYPTGVSKRANQALERLITQGHTAGIHFVVQRLSTATPEDEFDPDRSLAAATRIVLDGSRVHVAPPLEALVARFDEPPSPDLIAAISDQVAANAASAAAPNLDFTTLLVPETARWSWNSQDRLEVTLGRRATETACFTLGDQVEQLHNVLIGGAVGTGKSNVLLVLLHDLASKYGPDELEMYLLDFKEGLEFSSLAPSAEVPYGLPHARVLGLETDRHLGLQVLRHLEREFAQRAALFKAARVANYGAFRDARRDLRMPRLLLVIDEFQVLVDGEDAIADESVRLLETLARKGRAYGIHLVLASQTLSGLRSLITKEGAILSQFPIRVALRTTAEESQVLLEAGNRVAADLRFRGEAILNTRYGSPVDNQQVVIARATEDTLDHLRQDLWRNRPSDLAEPYVFNGQSQPPLVPALKHLPTSRDTAAMIGRPVALHDVPLAFPLSSEPGRHLALIGPGDDDGMEVAGTLHAAVVSVALSLPPGARFVVVDLLTPHQRSVVQIEALAAALQRLGHEVDLHPGHELPSVLEEIGEDLRRRADGPSRRAGRVIVVGAGMHGAIRLDESPSIGADAPIEVLKQLVSDGPVLGYHLIGWWNNVKSFQQQIDTHYTIQGLWQGFALLRTPLNELREIVGHTAEWVPAPNRLVAYDRRKGGLGELALPFAPLSPDSLMELLR